MFSPENHLSAKFLNKNDLCETFPKESQLSVKEFYKNDLTAVSCNENHTNDRPSNSSKENCYKFMVHSFLERVVEGTEKRYKFQRTVC